MPYITTKHYRARYTERLAAAGIESSVGSVGDSYDNALAPHRARRVCHTPVGGLV